MPTKLNRAGNQQNYVPAGNGDASGEYGDHETGSNIHFKQFKKPSETQTLSKEQMIEMQKEWLRQNYKKQLEKGMINNFRYERRIRDIDNRTEEQLLNGFYENFPEYKKQYDDFNSFIDDKKPNVSATFLNGLKRDFTYGTDESKKLVMNMLNHSTMTYDCTDNDEEETQKRNTTYFNPYNNKVFMNNDEYEKEQNSYVKGGVFYHESGHAIDGNFNYVFENGEVTNLYGDLSTSYKLSTGKTLKETLMGRKKWSTSDRLEEAQKEEKQFKKEFYDSQGFSDIQGKIEAIQNEAKETKEYKEQQQLLQQYDEQWEKNIEKYGSIIEFRNQDNETFTKLRDIRATTSENLMHMLYDYKGDEQKTLRQEIKDVEYKYRSKMHQTFGDISDMFCMLGCGYTFGMGHKTSYARDTDLRANEFFAECFSAESTNPESLKLIKKYFPEGYKAYREIMDAINSGKLITREQYNTLKKKGEVAN